MKYLEYPLDTIFQKNGCKVTINFPNLQIVCDFFILFGENLEMCNIYCNFVCEL